MTLPGEFVDRLSPPEAKIALFRSLFRGRDDVYPRRFESRTTGKSGYQPACANEWARGVCEKPRIKCTACLHQRFLPVTDEAIRWHLSGQDDKGTRVCVRRLSADAGRDLLLSGGRFRQGGLAGRRAALLETCRRMSLPAALERSRSGNGGHVWLFFEQAIPAALARKLGCAPADRNHGTASRHRSRFLRPLLPQSRHASARRLRQSDRVAAATGAAAARQQRVSRRRPPAARRSMGLPLRSSQD